MKHNIAFSTRFATSQGSHEVGVLATVSGERPQQRRPLNLALVLDRSGSMDGEKLHAAREAAARFVSFLQPSDRLALVAFETEVDQVWGPAPADPLAAARALARIRTGGQTNLSGGWLAGRTAVASGLLDGVNRVIMFTDGQANVGLTAIEPLVGLARSGQEQQVSTSCIGFGEGFNEELLKGMSDAGGGNFWFVERHDLMGAIFDEEIEGLVSLAAQNLTIDVRASHPAGAGVTFLQSYPVTRLGDGHWRVRIGDVYAVSPRTLGCLVHVNAAADTLGTMQLAELVLEADVVRADGVEHQVITMSVVANLDGKDHVEPVVERELLLFRAAQAREEASRLAADGDLQGAEATLRTAADALKPHMDDPRVADDANDLEEHAERLREGAYDELDRKYMRGRSWAASEGKLGYLGKMRREPRKPRSPS